MTTHQRRASDTAMFHADIPDTAFASVANAFRIAYRPISFEPVAISGDKRAWIVSVSAADRDLLERSYLQPGQVSAETLGTVQAHLQAGRKNDAVRFLRHKTGWPLADAINFVNAL